MQLLVKSWTIWTFRNDNAVAANIGVASRSKVIWRGLRFVCWVVLGSVEYKMIDALFSRPSPTTITPSPAGSEQNRSSDPSKRSAAR